MAIILQDDFSDLSNVTADTDGNVTFAAVGNNLVATVVTGAASWSGYYSASPVTVQDGYRLYCSVERTSAAGEGFVVGSGRSGEAHMNEIHYHFADFQGSDVRAAIWGSNFGPTPAVTFSTGVRFYILIIYYTAGLVIYYNNTGWSDDLGDWALLSTSSTAGIDEHGQNIYYKAEVLGQSTGNVFSFGPWAFTDENGLELGPPAVPDNVTITGGDEDKVFLSWDASAGATSYKIYVNDVLNSTSATNSKHVDVENFGKDMFTFKVSAVNDQGESAKSTGVVGTTAPLLLAATAVSHKTIDISATTEQE